MVQQQPSGIRREKKLRREWLPAVLDCEQAVKVDLVSRLGLVIRPATRSPEVLRVPRPGQHGSHPLPRIVEDRHHRMHKNIGEINLCEWDSSDRQKA